MALLNLPAGEGHRRGLLELSDGRRLDFSVHPTRDDGRGVLLWHHGTPGSVLEHRYLAEVANDAGLSIIGFSRPGYGGSNRRPERSVVDITGDAVALLDHLGVEDFLTAGWSGGGPHALACAARVPDRCLAVATVAGVAPFYAQGLVWMEGMGPENQDEFGLALEKPDELKAALSEVPSQLASIGVDGFPAMLGGLVSESDLRSLEGPVAEMLLNSMRDGTSEGVDGWFDDDLAFTRPWGFDPGDIEAPASLWIGGQDLMVPAAHGDWLASRLRHANPHRIPGEGHISLADNHRREIVEDLVSLAKL